MRGWVLPRGDPTDLAKSKFDITGMHATKDRPVVVDGQIVIRPVMVVALTYDHRMLDGREAVTFLGAWTCTYCSLDKLLMLLPWKHIVRVKEYIEDPRKMLLA